MMNTYDMYLKDFEDIDEYDKLMAMMSVLELLEDDCIVNIEWSDQDN